MTVSLGAQYEMFISFVAGKYEDLFSISTAVATAILINKNLLGVVNPKVGRAVVVYFPL